jgi:catalase
MSNEHSNQAPDPTTTDAGIPVASDEHSLTIGANGPILLQDHYLRVLEKHRQRNRRQDRSRGT